MFGKIVFGVLVALVYWLIYRAGKATAGNG